MNTNISFSTNVIKWLEAVITERFGHRFQLAYREQCGLKTFVLSLSGANGSIVFDQIELAFHQSSSDFPCECWDALSEGFLPVLSNPIPAPSSKKLTSPLIEKIDGDFFIHYDIPGLIFWMLSRLEEIGRTDLDEHERFSASASHAFKHDYLERPIVDEWLDILGQVMLRQWPQIMLKQNCFRMRVSHDVDAPARYAFLRLPSLVRSVGSDLIKKRDFKSAVMASRIWLGSKNRIHPKDPLNTFDWLMTQSEQNGLISAFYFICGRTNPLKDALYNPEDTAIRNLMREIHARGHEIGLHPSYNTFRKPELIKKEADRLRSVCKSEGIEQQEWGGRMHFLRWDQSVTQKAWADAGMSYDSTLSYADRPGFRCGTCYEYPAFDTVNDRQLSLRIRPLVAMDCTVIAERYLGLGSTEKAYEKFLELEQTCRKVGGVFTLLWHNSYFNNSMDFSIYQRLVTAR